MKARTWSLLGKGMCLGGFRTNENKPECQNTGRKSRSDVRNVRAGWPVFQPVRSQRSYSAASAFGVFAFLDLLGAFAALAAARFFGLASALAVLAFAGALGAAALVALAPRAGRFLRALEPPPVASARASISAAASSNVIVSGVLSFGRLALTPLWLTYGP